MVVLGPSRSSAWLGSVLAQALEQKSSAWLAMPSKKLGSPYLAKKSLVQLGLLYHLKNRVTLKNKK